MHPALREDKCYKPGNRCKGRKQRCPETMHARHSKVSPIEASDMGLSSQLIGLKICAEAIEKHNGERQHTTIIIANPLLAGVTLQNQSIG